MTSRRIVALVVAGLGQFPVLAGADERKAAEVECTPVEQQALVYDCTFTLKGRKSGKPVADAEFTVGADMPSMPGAHYVRPVPAEPHDTPGMYRARIELEMTGERTLKLDFTRPGRDRLVRKLHFGATEAHDGHKHE